MRIHATASCLWPDSAAGAGSGELLVGGAGGRVRPVADRDQVAGAVAAGSGAALPQQVAAPAQRQMQVRIRGLRRACLGDHLRDPRRGRLARRPLGGPQPPPPPRPPSPPGPPPPLRANDRRNPRTPTTGSPLTSARTAIN